MIYAPELREAELMYNVFDSEGITPIFENLDDVLAAIDSAGHKV